MELFHSARVVATNTYTLKTLSVRTDLLVVVCRGRKHLHIPGTTLYAGTGQGVVLAQGTQWDVTNDPQGSPEYQAIALAFPDALLQELNALEGSTSIPVMHSAHVLTVDEELLSAMQRTLPPVSARPMSDSLLRHRMMEVLLLLAQRGVRFAGQYEVSWADKVRRLVAQRPHADWDVPTLATAFHISESTLRRRLNGSGTTLAALIKEVRLELALNMLQTTRLSIGEVAQLCGWQSHSRFSAAFLERWGVPPSVVRARLKDDAQKLTESG